MKTLLPTPLKYQKNKLSFEGHDLQKIMKNKKTPCYLYSKKTMTETYQAFYKEAIKAKIPNPLVCFAVKANPNHEVLTLLRKHGAGADVVSGGELKAALKAGIDPQKIVFSGVGKTKEEILFALRSHPYGIYSFNVESIEELEMINTLAKKENKIARIAFRLNPRVNAKTHKHISTGNKTHKFGLLRHDIEEALINSSLWTHSTLVGLSIHIGSQLTELKATEKAIKEMCDLAMSLEHPIEFLDVGGGLGIDYTEKDRKELASISAYMKAVYQSLHQHYFKKVDPLLIPRIVFEPGRILVGKMGVLVSKVVRTKQSEDCHFTIIDAGMNDLMRPALYEAFHEIYPYEKTKKLIATDVVGPICESTDIFGAQRKLPRLKSEDLVVIDNAGAYGRSMANRYNERELAPEYFI